MTAAVPRLRFPRVPSADSTPGGAPASSVPALPPELRRDAPPLTATLLLSRRQPLRAAAVAAATLAVPWTHAGRARARVDEIARAAGGARFVDLHAAAQDAAFALLDQGAFAPDPRRGGATWPTILVPHVLEGRFGAPEPGGNRRAAGWRAIGFEGDSQPPGSAVWSETLGARVERADRPLSTPNPDELAPDGTVVPRPLGPDAQRIQASILARTAPFANGEPC